MCGMFVSYWLASRSGYREEVAVDRVDLARTLDELRMERSVAERQLAALQRRVDALRKAADGLEELLTSSADAYASSEVTVRAPGVGAKVEPSTRPESNSVDDT